MATKRGNGEGRNGEGSIYKSKDRPGYRAAYTAQTAKGPKRRYVSGKTRREVEEKLTKAKAERDVGLVFDAGRLSFGEYLEQWLSNSVRDSVRPSTYKSYAWLVRAHAVPVLGRTKLKALSPAHVRALYRAKLDAGLSPRTVEYLHALLRRALKQAVRWGLVPLNAAEVVDPPRAAKKELRHLSLEEAKLFLESSKDDRFGALYALALTTGLRRGELLGLRWEDLDLGRRLLSVRRSLTPDGKAFAQPKGAKGRSIRLTPRTVEALERHRRAQHEERLRLDGSRRNHGLVFCSTAGTPMNPNNLVNRSFRPLLERAGLPRIRFHDLRHTFATLMLRGGEHPKIVQEMLGHAQISLTLDTYSHVLPDMQDAAVGRLGDLLS